MVKALSGEGMEGDTTYRRRMGGFVKAGCGVWPVSRPQTRALVLENESKVPNIRVTGWMLGFATGVPGLQHSGTEGLQRCCLA